MRIGLIASCSIISILAAGCTIASPWKQVDLLDGWVGVVTEKRGVGIMFGCRVPTEVGSAGTYDVRIKSGTIPTSAVNIVRISKVGRGLAEVVLTSPEGGFYRAPMNTDEAARVFEALVEPGGIAIKAQDFVDVEVALASDDLDTLTGFLDKCRR